MKKNYKLFFALAVGCGLLAALVAVYAFNTIAKMKPVVVASQNIKADEAPTSRTVTMGKEPAGALKVDSVTDFSQLKGMVAKGFIPEGTPLRLSMFQPVKGAGLAARLGGIGSDKVAVAIPSSVETTLGNALKRGDKVIVKAAGRDGVVQEFSQNAEVLDVPNKENGVNAVVLAVPVAEADKISSGQVSGLKIWCELLPPSK